jgi:hypothetical protein
LFLNQRHAEQGSRCAGALTCADRGKTHLAANVE